MVGFNISYFITLYQFLGWRRKSKKHIEKKCRQRLTYSFKHDQLDQGRPQRWHTPAYQIIRRNETHDTAQTFKSVPYII